MQHRRSCQNFCSIHVYVLPTAAEYVQHHVRFVNVQLSLPKNVVFSVCAHMGNAAYIIFIMWNSISGLDAWYHIQFNVSYGVAVTVRSHQIKERCQAKFLEGHLNELGLLIGPHKSGRLCGPIRRPS